MHPAGRFHRTRAALLISQGDCFRRGRELRSWWRAMVLWGLHGAADEAGSAVDGMRSAGVARRRHPMAPGVRLCPATAVSPGFTAS